MAHHKVVIGFAGQIASGKGTAAAYLAQHHGASVHRFSTMLRDLLDRLYLEQSRDHVQKISTAIRQTFGDDLMAQVMAHDVERDPASLIAVDGVRREPDIVALRTLPGFALVYIEADMEVRYQRLRARGENTDDTTKTYEDFIADHQRETEVRIADLQSIARFTVDNNGDLAALHRQLDDIVSQLTHP